MPYDDETGHSYFKSDAEAEQWDSLYILGFYPFPAYYNQQQDLMPIVDETPFIPYDPLAQPIPCLQCNDPYHMDAMCPTTFQDIPSATGLLYHDVGASVYLEGNVTKPLCSIGFITIWRETRPCNPNQIMEEC